MNRNMLVEKLKEIGHDTGIRISIKPIFLHKGTKFNNIDTKVKGQTTVNCKIVSFNANGLYLDATDFCPGKYDII